MPTYEYRCGACGNTFEKFQKMSDDPVRTCPGCGQECAERMISSGAGLIFKGSGFYATDYQKKGSGDEGPGSDPDDGAGASGASGEDPNGEGGSSDD